MPHRGEPCDRSKKPPDSCQLCPCESFLPSQEKPFPPSAGHFSVCCAQEGSTGLHAGPRELLERQVSPLRSLAPLTRSSLSCSSATCRLLPTPTFPSLCLMPSLTAGPFPLGGRACRLSSFLDFFIYFHVFCLLSLLLLGKLSNIEQRCTSNSMSVFVSLDWTHQRLVRSCFLHPSVSVL